MLDFELLELLVGLNTLVIFSVLSLICWHFKYSVSVIDKLDYVFSENGLVAKDKGVEIERTVSIIEYYSIP